VPAPSLEGGVEWINSSGPISLRELRGKLVILDFWTYCCINCLQTLPELKRLEQAYRRELVVIGVHTPKFLNEHDTDNIREAVVRHQVDHPVVNDAGLAIARKYGVEVWPSLRVIDPQGYLIASHQGEATFEMLNRFVRRTLARYRRQRALDETPLRFDLERYAVKPTPLRFPGKVLADASSRRLFIADSGHNRIVIASLDGTLLETVGSGQVGRQDGPYDQASFSHPQGMALAEDDLFVADTENHLLRRIDLASKHVTTVAGTGQQARQFIVRSTAQPLAIPLASPWDLWWHQEGLYIAMAGTHQVWKMSLDRLRLGPFAGSGTEDIVDGRLLPRTALQPGFAAFAQPSGLASDGEYLYVADSEGSSIRAVPIGGKGSVATLLGTARLPAARLFTFGDRDGPVRGALLQHPLGLAWWRNRLYVADTYNNKIKEIDLGQLVIKTIAGDGQPGLADQPARFDEPAGLSVAEASLYVADTNNHAIRVIDLEGDYAVRTLTMQGLEPPEVPAVDSLPEIPGAKKIDFGTVEVNPTDDRLRMLVELRLPAGCALNPQAPMSYVVNVKEGDAILDPAAIGKRAQLAEPAEEFQIALPLSRRTGSAKLEIWLVYFYCHEQSQALCKMGSAIWRGEVKLTPRGAPSPMILKHVVL
jgi:thiol-disulfide isomerase/thioredoxin